MIKNLKSLRQSKYLTQAEAAIGIGVSLATYRMWEKGVTVPNDENLIKLKKFFNVQ